MTECKGDTIEACIERIQKAWGAGDPAAFAAEFTEDATYVVYFGLPLRGRPEIEKMHVEPLGRGTHMRMKVLSARPLTNDVSSVLTVAGVGMDAAPPYDKVQTLTLLRRDGRWICASFQNTELGADAKRLYNNDSSF